MIDPELADGLLPPLDRGTPDEVSSEIERLVQGEGPFADARENELTRVEDISIPSAGDESLEDDASAATAQLNDRLSALEALVASPPPVYREPEILPDGIRVFIALLGIGVADGDNSYAYPFTEGYQTATGYGNFATVSGGASGTARNLTEDPNDGASGTDILGNGVQFNHLATDDWTFELEPAPNGALVLMTETTVAGVLQYWFQYENAVDGECDA